MRRRLGLILFLLLFGSIIALTHFYLILRLVLLPQVPSPFREALIAVTVILGACLFLRPIAERFLDDRIAAALSWPAFVWMGVSFFLLVLLLGSDLVLSALGRAAWAIGETSEASALSDRAQATMVAVGGLVFSVWGMTIALGRPAIRRIELAISAWPSALDAFRIVQLSDVHIGPLLDRRFAESIVACVNALEPDVIAITGDLVDGSVERLGAEVEPLRRLEARHGTFFVTGNHDYFSRADPWIERARELGWRVLRNERVTIGSGEDAFDLAGVDDRIAHLFGGDHGEDLERALHGRDRRRPIVLLAHNPATFDAAAESGVDLQLSGHTHGGQIWPFVYLVRLITPYVAGIYRRGQSVLYVSRGTGFWGPPMRLFKPAEITEIRMRSTDRP
jgi:predicted MPP superfamily phosphohydrolase